MTLDSTRKRLNDVEPGALSRRIFRCAAGFVFILAFGSPLAAGAAPPQAGSRPNIVVVLADDKYECAAHEAENLRQNRQITAFSAQSQIARNCGEFRGIAGN
jgi:hypothetical protein